MEKRYIVSLRKNITAYLFIAPFFLVYCTFHLYPQVYSIILSFFEYKFVGKSIFLGFLNYIGALQDKIFWKSLGNTAVFWLMTLPVQIVIAFLIASVMTKIASTVRGLLSGFYYMPVVTNLVAVTLVFQLMFDEYYGVFNFLLSIIGVQAIPWLTSPIWAKFSTVLLIIWRGLGYYIVYTLAGLMSVDRELYEYASLEGAGFFQKTIHITVPSIAPIMLYQVFTGTIAGWNIFLEPFLLFKKGGGPLGSALTSAIYIYQEGFSNLKFGYGAAMSIMVALVTTIFAVLQFKLFRTDVQGNVK
jgi:ABC-type sugar transport system permease subunit